jgi:hypothetical protein
MIEELSKSQQLNDMGLHMVKITETSSSEDESEVFFCPEGITRVPFTCRNPRSLTKSMKKSGVYSTMSPYSPARLHVRSLPLTTENIHRLHSNLMVQSSEVMEQNVGVGLSWYTFEKVYHSFC